MSKVLDKTSRSSMVLEKKLLDLVIDARKRRLYIHAVAMRRFTPIQYDYVIPILSKQGYGVNVFSTNHIHPPLSMAILGRHVEAVESLLMAGANLTLLYKTNDGLVSPSHILMFELVKYKNQPFIFKKYCAIFNLLIRYGLRLDHIMYSKKAITFRDFLIYEGVDLISEQP